LYLFYTLVASKEPTKLKLRRPGAARVFFGSAISTLGGGGGGGGVGGVFSLGGATDFTGFGVHSRQQSAW
jgi:hypothetical protein